MLISASLLSGILIVLLAGFTQGLTSFGFALVAVPILSGFIPISQVVPVVVVLCLGTNALILLQCWRSVELSKIWLLVLASLIGAPLGTQALLHIEASTLKLLVGILIVLISLLMLSGKTFPVRSERRAMLPVGFMSGFLNGSISMSGPPVALFMSNQGADKAVFRANITAYGIILNLVTLVSFWCSNLLTGSVLHFCAWLVPTMVAGVLLGSVAVSRISQPRFRRLTLLLILMSGLWTIWGVLTH